MGYRIWAWHKADWPKPQTGPGNSYLFRDYGAVGRVPYLVPFKWEDGWPVLGTDGKVPDTLDLPQSKGLIPGIVTSDEFTRKKGERALPLVWQWNHNPDNSLWSVTQRKGYLRLTTGRIDTDLNIMGFPSDFYEGLLSASSKGTYFGQFIKRAGYSYARV